MSCGKPHEIDCGEILNEVYLFLDLECSDDRRAAIQHHLSECTSCLREYGIEQEVRTLVQRCCGSDQAPDVVRERLRIKIAALRVEIAREPG